MGEAKRRRRSADGPGNVSWTDGNDPRVQAIFEEAGEPITVALVGAALIMPSVATISFDELMKPQHRVLRLAFGVFDRIRNGEIDGRCGLCGARHNVNGFSCYAVIERVRGTSLKKPALTLPVCHNCDSVSTQETQRRVLAMFPLAAGSRGGIA